MRARTFPFLFMAAWLTTVTVGANRAQADVPPPDLCTSPGQPCQNAGPQFNQVGTCAATTCTKTLPNGDGGTTTMMYDCNLCRTSDGGTSGGGHSSSGCAVAARGTIKGSEDLAVAVALLGLALARRRRRTSR